MSRDIQEVKDNLVLSKQRTQTLIDTINETTGGEDTDLTKAVGTLVSGYGQDEDAWIEDNSEVVFEDTCYRNGNVSAYISANGTLTYKRNSIEYANQIPAWSYSNFNQKIPNHLTDTTKFFTVKQAEVVNIDGIADDRLITSLGRGTFACLPNLKVVRLPDTIATLDDYIFTDCHSLKKIELPSAVISIGPGCFANCFELEYFNIPSGVTSLGGNMFVNCYRLKTVSGIERMTSIGNGCFDNCLCLCGMIVFNEQLTSIGSYTFRNCPNIEGMQFNGIPTNIDITAFYNCVGIKTFSIPTGWNITLYLQNLTSLTNESVQSIIDALADLTGQTAQTITLHSTVSAKLTDEQLNTIYAKNWTIE